MKPLIFQKMVQHHDITLPVVYQHIPMYMDSTGTKIGDSDISAIAVSDLADRYTEILGHIDNPDIHVTTSDKNKWDGYVDQMSSHINDNTIHISEADRTKWDNKETEEGAQLKANIVQTNLNAHINNLDVHVTIQDKNKWSNSYTKEEIDNKFSMMEFNNDWKEAVQSYDDLFTTYPDPYEGWTVNVLENGITYRFDGEEWVAISANSIPLATQEIDGLMSHTDKAKLDGIEEHANNYIHPDNPNIRHVTDEQIKAWNNKAEKDTANYNADGLMSKEDKYKLDGIEEGATNYVEPDQFDASKIKEDENHRFVTDEEKTYWSNKANSNLASANLDGLMSISDKKKLDTIETNANYYVHPQTHPATIIVQDEEHRFVTDEQITAWNAKAEVSIVNPGTNTAGLMTVADKIKLDGIEENANHYIHPDTHPASIIVQDATHRFVAEADIVNWNNKKDSSDIISGDGIFNSTDGTIITHKMGGTNYAVAITILDNPTDVGTVYVTQDNYSCTVYCTGVSRTAKFTYVLVKYYR